MKQRKMRGSGRLLALLLALVMAASMAPAALASSAADGMKNFKKIRDYEGFSDVSEGAWYYEDVRGAYEMGLISGSNGKFNPDGNLTLAEAITMACNVRHTYCNDDFKGGGDPWYQNAVDYASKQNIIQERRYSNYEAPATRRHMAYMFAHSLPANALTRINRIGWIPDVDVGSYGFQSIYTLYNAGVLTGGDSGNFRPDDTITRAEAAALINRLANPDKRVKFTLTGNAPGVVVESDDGTVRVSCPSDQGWMLHRDEQSSSMTLYKEDNSAQVDIRIVKKSAAGKTIKEWSEDAVEYAENQGSTIDNKLYSSWIRGLAGYSFVYHYTNSEGTLFKGEYFCVENSDCFVYMWVVRKSDNTSEILDVLDSIVYSIDLAL